MYIGLASYWTLTVENLAYKILANLANKLGSC